MNANIRYREIKGFPDYCIGEDGTVWSSRRRGRRFKHNPNAPLTSDYWHQLSTPVLPNGYPSIALRQNGKVKTLLIHQLVLEAFVGPCPSGMEACHFPDRSKANCRLDNLRWDTRQANSEDAMKHGTRVCGERVANSKLSELDIVNARNIHEQGNITIKELAELYEVSHATMGAIIRKESWKHI